MTHPASCPPVRSFRDDLAHATRTERDPRLLAALERRYGPFAYVRQVSDLPTQRMGVDLILHRPNGEKLYAQVKSHQVDYSARWRLPPDILLESISDLERGTPGWIAKPSWTDVLAVHYLDSGRIELLPFQALQQAWLAFGDEWQSSFPNITTRTVGQNGRVFHSKAVIVPRSVIHAALRAVGAKP